MNIVNPSTYTTSGGPINNQNKTVTPTTSSQSITADAGYTGLGTVTVNAVTSAIDANITAGNIKKDVTILGVTGTYEGTSEILPDSNLYTTLSYIDTQSNNCYIDTDLGINTEYKLTFDVSFNAIGNYPIFGSRYSTNSYRQVAFCPNASTGNIISYQCGTTYTFLNVENITFNTNTRYTITFERDKITVDGTGYTGTVGTAFTAYSAAPIRLFNFCTALQADTRYWTGKLYSLKVELNGVKIKDYIPVQRIADSKYGLWDKVSGTFYVGVGTFTGA